MDREQLREIRQNRANQKAARFRLWAESAEKKSDKERAKHSGFSGDYAFITQPLLVGHHSYNRMKNLRDRISRQMDKEQEYRKMAQSYRERADRLESNVKVAGDAEQRRELKRQENDQTISVGCKVRDFVFGDGEVFKVNKKTYSIKFTSGWKTTRDKTFVKPNHSTKCNIVS